MRFFLFLFLLLIAFPAAPALAEEPWPEPWGKSSYSSPFDEDEPEERKWKYFKPQKVERDYYDASHSSRQKPCPKAQRKWGQSMETKQNYEHCRN